MHSAVKVRRDSPTCPGECDRLDKSRMTVGYKTWTVLTHQPIEILAPNVWRVEGRLNASNTRVMTLVRLRDGRIVIHNAVALDEPSMARIDAWGEVAAILVPNRFHRMDAHIMRTRYPRAKVFAPSGALAAAAKATPIDGGYADVPMDDTVSVRDLDGIGKREGVVVARSSDGATAVFCDTLLNLPKLSGLMGMMLHPTGTLSVPRPTSLLFAKDRTALRADLERIASEEGLIRLIPGHGAVVAVDAPRRLREAAGRL